jgi:uncharacterized membrane protein YeaQ/YmgE (transglycosylase-associated protein family)
MTSLLGWIIVGLVAGWLANMATGTRSRGCLTTMAVGIVGALLGGLLFEWAGQPGLGGSALWSILVAFVGATLLLLVLHGVDRR